MEERQQVNIEVQPLNVFMEVYLFDQMPSDKTGVVTYFKLDEDTRKMAEVLHTFQESHLFKMCWEKEAKLLAADDMDADTDMEEMATPEMIHYYIFKPSFDEYKKIHTCLKNGHITLAQVNELFGDYKGKYDELTQELEIMCRIEESLDRKWIHTRVQQIEQYHELHLAVASAEIIMRVKETLCLQGDFRVLETLTKAVSGHVFISYITPQNFTHCHIQSELMLPPCIGSYKIVNFPQISFFNVVAVTFFISF